MFRLILQRILKPSQMVVVTDQMRRETTGTVSALSASSLTLAEDGEARRTFSEDAVYTIRRTDPLGNGTLIGAVIGAAPAIALLGSCGGSPEAAGPCKAAALLGLVIAVPMGALLGRAADRAIGNQEVYYRRPPQTSRIAISPWFKGNQKGVVAQVRF